VLFGVFAVASPAIGQGLFVNVESNAEARGEITDTDRDFDAGEGFQIAGVEVFALAEDARVTTAVRARALMQRGDFSLYGSVWVDGVKLVPPVFWFGTGTSFARAAQTDFANFRAETHDIGSSLFIRAKLNIKGEFGTITTDSPNIPNPPGPTIPGNKGAVQGSLNVFGSRGAFFSEANSINPIDRTLAFVCKNACSSGDVNRVAPGEIYWNMIVPNGQPIDFSYSFTLFMEATAGQNAEAFIFGDFSGSIHWGGIVSVEDAVTGEVIDDWTVTSASGFDYSKPFGVPEPSSMLLLATALCARLALGRRRRSVYGSQP
jgi:hypothetical protein